MSAVLGETVLKQMKWRYATKKFDSGRKIPADTWQVLEQALVLSPSSYGLQPWKFFVVVDPIVKAKLPSISWGQTQPNDCSHMVVLAIRKDLGEADIDRYLARLAEIRGQSIAGLGGFKKMLLGTLANPPFDINEWAARQVYIALGQFMASAAILGIDTCPMEGIEPQQYDDLLGIASQGYQTCVGCAAGYRDLDDKFASVPKVRFKTEDVVQVI